MRVLPSLSKTHVDFSLELSSAPSSDDSDDEFNAVTFPKDSLAFPKKSFTLSRTVFSSACVGS